MSENIVVIGGGIGGLTAAWLLRRKFPTAKVIVVERADHLGGLVKTYDYGEFGRFDCGMHWITETGNALIDQFFLDLLPDTDWIYLEGARRDLSGLFYGGRLQENSQFPDLRNADPKFQRDCLADFFDHLRQPQSGPPETMLEHARARFGRVIADSVIAPIAAKVHGMAADQLHPMARFLPLLDRVILFDPETSLDLMGSHLLRDRLAFPEQRELPLSYSSGRRSYYPRHYGIDRVIDALTARLTAQGVEIITGAEIRRIHRDNRRISGLDIEAAGQSRTLAPIKHLVWTADSSALAKLLDVAPTVRPGTIRRTVIVSLLLRQPPRMGDLYCFFCADAPHGTYRVNNFTAVCPEAPRAGGYPVSVELFVNHPQAGEQPDYAAQAMGEIIAFGLIDSPDDVMFARAETLVGGFPCLGLGNIAGIDAIRTQLDALDMENLIRGGILAEPGQFFQHHVLVDLHDKIDAL
jgi:protoporphyrinogen oxidase